MQNPIAGPQASSDAAAASEPRGGAVALHERAPAQRHGDAAAKETGFTAAATYAE